MYRFRLPKITLAEAAYLLCAFLAIVDIIAIIMKAASKQVTVMSIINPLSWILGPVTAHGWSAILVLTVLALLAYLVGARLKKRAVRR